MASFQSSKLSALDSATAMQVDLTWQMAKASLAATNQQVLINANVYKLIGDAGLEEIKVRLSKFLGNVPVIACIDQSNEVVRVMEHIERALPTAYSMKNYSTSSQSSDLESSFSMSNPLKPALRAFGKKAKVPRPPNAFILYRQHWHPHYRQNNKDMHNNDISKEIGKRWKAESDFERAKYKKLAEDLKAKHTSLYPDYQYAPRKPGEKKRRMTARKLEKLRGAQSMHEAAAFSSPESSSISGVDSPGQGISNAYGIEFVATPSPANDLDMEIMATTPPQPIQYLENEIFTSTLPSTFDNIQAEIDKECGKYGETYVDVALKNGNNAETQSGHHTLQATPASSQTDQQNEWESLIDWQGLNNVILESEDMNEEQDQDVITEQRSGPDQSHKSYEEPTIFWK